jgi:hypothetical protein
MDLPRDNVPFVRTAETTIKANKLDRETLVLCTVISNKSHLMKYHAFRKETIAHPIHLVNQSLSEGLICKGNENAYQTWNQRSQPPSHSREASSIFQKMNCVPFQFVAYTPISRSHSQVDFHLPTTRSPWCVYYDEGSADQ